MEVQQGYHQQSFKRTGNSLVPNNILPFSHMFHKAESLLYFDILRVIFNELGDNFVFACNFPGKLRFNFLKRPQKKRENLNKR